MASVRQRLTLPNRSIGAEIRTAHAIEAGWVQINQGLGQTPGHSYGGYKESGIGREFSRNARELYAKEERHGQSDAVTRVKLVAAKQLEPGRLAKLTIARASCQHPGASRKRCPAAVLHVQSATE